MALVDLIVCLSAGGLACLYVGLRGASKADVDKWPFLARTASRVLWIALGVSAVVFVALIVHLDYHSFRAPVFTAGGPPVASEYGSLADVVRHAVFGDPTPVLVAKQLIPKGTPGALIATKTGCFDGGGVSGDWCMFAATTRPAKQVVDDAISDPAYLRGRTTAVDINPGQQLTTTQFAP